MAKPAVFPAPHGVQDTSGFISSLQNICILSPYSNSLHSSPDFT